MRVEARTIRARRRYLSRNREGRLEDVEAPEVETDDELVEAEPGGTCRSETEPGTDDEEYEDSVEIWLKRSMTVPRLMRSTSSRTNLHLTRAMQMMTKSMLSP